MLHASGQAVVVAAKGVSAFMEQKEGGYACEYLARRGAVVHGTDLLQESLEEAGRHAKESGLEIDYRLCTIERLPFDNDSADVITCFDVLEHVPDKPRLLSEIHRISLAVGIFMSLILVRMALSHSSEHGTGQHERGSPPTVSEAIATRHAAARGPEDAIRPIASRSRRRGQAPSPVVG
jgi:SAM-dependent methyltransferase